MRCKVDESLCVGCGQCVNACPEVFRFGGPGVEAIEGDVPPECRENAAQAMADCPVGAISEVRPEIAVVFEAERDRAAAYDGEKLVGECDFERRDDGWAVTHTETDPAYGGQGIARRMVLCVADAATAAEIPVIPICSYAVKVLKKS